MKLKHLEQETNERLLEFDTWITPTLEEISDTDKYHSELADTKRWLDILALENDNFRSPTSINSRTITKGILRGVSKLDKSEKISKIVSAASLLFLVTGKSDNNCKCQFPIYLRDVSNKDYIPLVRKKALFKGETPRVIKSTRIARIISDLSDFPTEQEDFLHDYVEFILDKQKYLNSFWTIGHSYISMRELGLENDLLMPIVVFKVRGSVSASGGHDPEHLLKDLMVTWGMQPEIDFNTTDIIVAQSGVEKAKKKKVKTRAYDFVLPFSVEEWDNRIFIQCQFYAGDSGSVSHKNVDQTRASREFTKAKIENPIFVEYLDGAGYYSSLNGDLKSILAMDDTHDFFQIKSAPLKLRKTLQQIGFLTVMELVHALSINMGLISSTVDYILSTGYTKKEIDRIFESAIEQNVINIAEDRKSADISDLFFNHSRQYFLLDQIYNFSQKLTPNEASVGGLILVPGLPGFHGTKLSEIADKIIPESGLYKTHLGNSSILLKDIEYLSNNKWIINH